MRLGRDSWSSPEILFTVGQGSCPPVKNISRGKAGTPVRDPRLTEIGPQRPRDAATFIMTKRWPVVGMISEGKKVNEKMGTNRGDSIIADHVNVDDKARLTWRARHGFELPLLSIKRRSNS